MKFDTRDTGKCPLSVLTGLILEEIYELFFAINETVSNIRCKASLIKSKAPVSQLVNAADTSVIEIKTQHYLES